MTIIGISGSPRRGGNTEMMLDEALRGAASAGARTEKLRLADLSFEPCLECGGCDRTGRCVLSDGLTPLYAKISASDAVIISSPIFFGTVSSQLKSFIDRYQCAWIAKYALKKRRPARGRKCVFLSAAGSRKRSYFESARKVVRMWCATNDIVYSGSLFCGGAEAAGAICGRKDILARAYRIGRRIAGRKR